MRINENTKKVFCLCAILILVLVVIFSGLQILESTVFRPGQGTAAPSKTITRDGVDYFPRQDLAVIMLLGVDDSGSAENSGTAEMIMLLVFDKTNEQCRILALDRDTMMEIPVPGAGENQVGQLGLAHTHGAGANGGCEITMDAVSDFLYGLRIDGYVCADMEALGVLNDLVGGIKVTVTDDFAQADPTITMGELTLSGQQAVNYVIARGDGDDPLNQSRTARQMGFMNGFMTALRTKLNQSAGFALSAYEKISPYIVTDCSIGLLMDIIGDYAGYEVVEIVAPPGESILNEEKNEFHADEEALDALILRLFYAPKE